MSEKKICPLISAGRRGEFGHQNCVEENCALWMKPVPEAEGRCAFVMIAYNVKPPGKWD